MTNGLTKPHIESIIRDRFRQWAKTLADNEATPLMAIGIGHGKNSGKTHIVTIDEMDDRSIGDYLYSIEVLLKRGDITILRK